MILSGIIESKRRRIEEAKKARPIDELKSQAAEAKFQRRNFKHAISQPHNINIIAEIKQASPTRGLIREDFNPAKIAEEYQINGACAISVLTEEDYFKGKLDYIRLVKEVSSVPVLRKDFIIDEYQVYESVLSGADAILLIADLLAKDEASRLYHLAKSFNISCLCEAHTEEDLEKILSIKADIIGINNRDLHTFKLSIDTTQNLMGLIPEGKIVVSESGIRSRSDVLFLKSLGINAVLIGEVFMDAEDVGARVREFSGRGENGKG